jgi:peptidase M23-like protein
MTRTERIRRFPKAGWRNLLARHMVGLIKRPVQTEFLNYQTQTALHLPFSGEWYVYWGGRSVAQNKHVVARDQRFAYDFMILAPGRAGQSYRGPGENNTDYFCFGLPVYAPAEGSVVRAENDVPDNTPGEMNAKAPLGNCVILDHGAGEFSFFAHFRCGTVVVLSGESVDCGQLLALCGNSGNSSEPHLHYHLQNTPVPFRGDGLPAFFVEYVADGKPLSRGEPVARQTVRSQREFSSQ